MYTLLFELSNVRANLYMESMLCCRCRAVLRCGRSMLTTISPALTQQIMRRWRHTHTHCQTSIIVVPVTLGIFTKKYRKSYFPPPTFCVVSQGLLELQKAQRCARQASGWDREWAGLERAVQLTLAYCHSQSNSFQSYSTSVSSELFSRGAFLKILCYRE